MYAVILYFELVFSEYLPIEVIGVLIWAFAHQENIVISTWYLGAHLFRNTLYYIFSIWENSDYANRLGMNYKPVSVSDLHICVYLYLIHGNFYFSLNKALGK